MKASPHDAFTQFLSFANDPAEFLSHTPEEYMSLIDSFLANPDRHKAHVQLLIGAASLSRLASGFWFVRPLFPLLRRGQWLEFREKVDRLRDELLATVEPGDFSIDFLPTRVVDTPDEWIRSGNQIHLLEVKTAVHPSEHFLPESVSLRVDVDGDTDAKLLEAFPSTEFSEVGEYEVGLTHEGKFMRSSSAGGKLQADIGYRGIGVTASAGASHSSEVSTSESVSQRFKYSNKVLKVLSSAVASTARWELLATTGDYPIGGQSFYATILLPKSTRTLSVRAHLSVSLADWGKVVREHEASVSVSRAPQPDDTGAADG